MIKLSEVIAYFAFAIILFAAVGIVMCKDAEAACPENGIPVTEQTTQQSPAQFVTSDICINWAAPLSIVMHHYHVYENDLMTSAPTSRSHPLTMDEKRVVFKIEVQGAAEDIELVDTPISDPLFVEWVDLQCLDGPRVVPCS